MSGVIERGDLAAAEAAAEAAAAAVAECKERGKAAQREMDEVLRIGGDLERKARTAREHYVQQKHVAEGLCAALLLKGERWHTRMVPCPKKAREGDRFCGTHRRSMTLRGVL